MIFRKNGHLCQIPNWEHSKTTAVSDKWNIGAMQGNWSFEFQFCDTVRLYMGNLTQGGDNLFGWKFGTLTAFDRLDVPVPPPGQFSASREFKQSYTGGDIGSPCSGTNPRSAIVYVWCGKNNNCSSIPGATSAQCLDGNSNSSFCLCSVEYNQTLGVCTGLTLHVLSNSCPESKAVPIQPGSPVPTNAGSVTGVVFLVLFLIVLAIFVGTYLYNCTVHGKRGFEGCLFYDTCCSSNKAPGGSVQYESAQPAGKQGYGAV